MKKKGTILIVDDAKDLAEILGEMLTMEGYLVTIFNDPTEAISYLEKETPEVIITDLIMPNMNGFEFVQRIRTKPKNDKTHLIAVSADLSEERMREGAAVGIDMFFSKPFDEDGLLKALSKLIKS